MIEAITGSKSKEQVLAFIITRKEGYARDIARTFKASVTPIQKQLENLELNGVLVSKNVGRTVVFQINPRYAFKEEVEALLKKAISFYPEELKEKLLYSRTRPRRQGKPL